MVLSKAYREEHIASFIWWFKHGGPHLLWLGGVFVVLYNFGVIDKPAWSRDVLKLQDDIKTVQTDVGDVKASIRAIELENVEQKTRQQDAIKTLDEIKRILLNRGLDRRRSFPNNE